jgi:hypothetical protein
MPLFRATRKLATALRLRLPKDPAEHPNPEHEWFADLFYCERKKCVVWVHRTTLLGFVRPAVTAAELREFHGLFRYEFRSALASMALPESLLDRFDVYGPESYAPTDDRAVVGSMLDYRKMFAFAVEREGGLERADVRAINAFLSDTPMSVLGGDSAVRVIRGSARPPGSSLH